MAQRSEQNAGTPASSESVGVEYDTSKLAALTPGGRHDLIVEAARVGASDEEIDGLKRLLGTKSLTADTANKVREKIAQMREARLAKTTPHWVQPGSKIRFHGQTYGPGDKIALTRSEADSMGDMVSSKAPPEPEPPSADRKAGKYRVKGPGSVKYARKMRRPGDVLDLDAEDARALGDLVESVRGS